MIDYSVYLYRTICIPCTNETSGALKLTDTNISCKKHGEISTLQMKYLSDAVCILGKKIHNIICVCVWVCVICS